MIDCVKDRGVNCFIVEDGVSMDEANGSVHDWTAWRDFVKGGTGLDEFTSVCKGQ